jgi:exopolysaccharide biosynthesis polyprenyl glycosylphosphotransferase
MTVIEQIGKASRRGPAADAPGGSPLRVVDPEAPGGSRWLRWALVGIDAVGVLTGWSIALLLFAPSGPTPARLACVAAGTVAALAATGIQRLYLARVAVVRSVELVRVARAAVVSAGGVYLAASLTGIAIPAVLFGVGVTMTFLLLASGRSFFDAWLKLARAQGKFLRPVVVVGGNAEGADLTRLLRTHPELGYRVAGVVGRLEDPSAWPDIPLLGGIRETADAVRRSGANGVIIASSALGPHQLNQVSRDLLHQKVHVHVSSGLKGIAPQRVRNLPLARVPFFYLEQIELSPWQFAVKRVIDVVLSIVALVVSLPVLVIAGAAIAIHDGGPILYRAQRVGRNARPFTMLKLRTMHPDADRRLDEIADQNERAGGPLFKMEDDPRRTRLGRVLEALSIDELPQLWNVLRGDMSVVGPRPALQSEVQQFDDELMIRLSVAPGVTGLWQVEARDNPSFDAYRRLDLFYVENWGVALDLSIILATARVLLVRLLHRGARLFTRKHGTGRASGSTLPPSAQPRSVL